MSWENRSEGPIFTTIYGSKMSGENRPEGPILPLSMVVKWVGKTVRRTGLNTVALPVHIIIFTAKNTTRSVRTPKDPSFQSLLLIVNGTEGWRLLLAAFTTLYFQWRPKFTTNYQRYRSVAFTTGRVYYCQGNGRDGPILLLFYGSKIRW